MFSHMCMTDIVVVLIYSYQCTSPSSLSWQVCKLLLNLTPSVSIMSVSFINDNFVSCRAAIVHFASIVLTPCVYSPSPTPHFLIKRAVACCSMVRSDFGLLANLVLLLFDCVCLEAAISLDGLLGGGVCISGMSSFLVNSKLVLSLSGEIAC